MGTAPTPAPIPVMPAPATGPAAADPQRSAQAPPAAGSSGAGALFSPTIAISGLSLSLFLVLHLLAVSQALLAPARFERLAAWLHAQPWLPWLELGLLGALLLHPALSLARTIADRSRGGVVIGPRRSRRRGPMEGLAARAGRWLPFSGGLLLLFLAVHLGQLRWQRPSAGAERQALLAALDSPVSLGLYGLAGLALALHLLHGHESAHRSLGLLESGNRAAIRWVGRTLALLLGVGFSLLPLALVLQQGLLSPLFSLP